MSLHERIAAALGWTVAEVRSFGLPSLRDMVRPVDAKLAYEITWFMQGPDYYTNGGGNGAAEEIKTP